MCKFSLSGTILALAYIKLILYSSSSQVRRLVDENLNWLFKASLLYGHIALILLRLSLLSLHNTEQRALVRLE